MAGPPSSPPDPAIKAADHAPAGESAPDAERRISDVLRAGRRLALFLDYDGTLREIEPDPAAAAPTPAVRELLGALANDARLDVTLISGRTSNDLDAFLAGYAFGMIAEHGASFRRPESHDWEHRGDGPGRAWYGAVRDLMRRYAASTPGTFVEEKRTSLVWHYRRADPEPADPVARQLAAELTDVASGHNLSVRLGKKIVEVTPAEVTKGAAVLRVLEGRRERYGLVVVAGDDATDESMFQLDAPDLLSIKVGAGTTRARCRVPDPSSLRRLLGRAIAGESTAGP